MDDIDFNELFGVEAQTPEAAEPEPEEVEQGEEVQEVAEPAESRDRAKDAEFAAARRKAEAERDAAVEEAKRAAKEEAEKYIAEAFKQSGMTNPYTNEPITSKEDYASYRKALDDDAIARVRDGAGMSEEEFSKFVGDLPEVREAREAKAAAEKQAAEAKKAEFQTQVAKEIDEIHALDPSITQLSDLGRMENYDTFKSFVDKGYSFIDSFKLANFDSLRQTSAKAAKQAAKNAESKEHLTRTESRGKGAEAVPADIMEQYRFFNPKATDDEILAHYNKSLKN